MFKYYCGLVMTIIGTTMLTRIRLAFASQSTYSSQVKKQILKFISAVSDVKSHRKASELRKVDIGIIQSEENSISPGGERVDANRAKEGKKFSRSMGKRVFVRTLDQDVASK